MDKHLLAEQFNSGLLVTILIILLIVCAIVWLFSRRSR